MSDPTDPTPERDPLTDLPSLEGFQLLHSADEALDRFELVDGVGDGKSSACVMTAIAWMTGAAHTDAPPCAHPTLGRLAIAANDAPGTTPEQRAEIVRLGETGLVDTWWVPPVVLLAAHARPGRAAPYPPEIADLLAANLWDAKARRRIKEERAAEIDAWRATHERPAEPKVERAIRVLAAISAWKELGRPRPDLEGADLRGADLEGADLEGADLEGADLEGADLEGADLRGADLEGADLEGAYLRGADLRGAYLRGADLRGAYLRGADLRGAYLEGAYLEGAYLEGAYLRGAYALQEAMGLGDDGMLDDPCDRWTGRVRDPEPYVTLEVPVGDNGHHMYFGGHDTEADATAALATLPDEVYVLAWGRPTVIRRDTIVVKSGERGGSESACHRCGHRRGDHADEGEPVQPSAFLQSQPEEPAP